MKGLLAAGWRCQLIYFASCTTYTALLYNPVHLIVNRLDVITSRIDVSGDRKNLDKKLVQGILLVETDVTSSPLLVLADQKENLILSSILLTCRPRSWSSGSWRWAPPGPRCTSRTSSSPSRCYCGHNVYVFKLGPLVLPAVYFCFLFGPK